MCIYTIFHSLFLLFYTHTILKNSSATSHVENQGKIYHHILKEEAENEKSKHELYSSFSKGTCCYLSVVLKPWCTSESPGILVKTHKIEAQCQHSDSTGLAYGPEMFISSKIPGDKDVAGIENSH